MIRIYSYKQYLDYIEYFRNQIAFEAVHPVFRGHALDTYQITPTLMRGGLSIEKALALEKTLLSKFKSCVVNNHIEEIWLNLPKDQSSQMYNWLCLFQARHLELPSRMIDWSMDHDTPLYFAVNNPDHFGKDGHIWLLKSPMMNFENLGATPELIKKYQDSYHHYNAGDFAQNALKIIDPLNPDKISLVHFPFSSGSMETKSAERRRAIQGSKFMVMPNQLLATAVENTIVGKMMHKIIIDGNSKEKIFKEQRENIVINDERVLVPIPPKAKEVLMKIETEATNELGIT